MKNLWTKEKILQESKNHITKKSFRTQSLGAYNAARKMNILDECYNNLLRKVKWTNSNIKEEASKYKTKNEFRNNNLGGYKAAFRLGLIDELYKNVYNTWDKTKLINEALKYKTRSEFNSYSTSAYMTARRLNILDEICIHMPKVNIDNKIELYKDRKTLLYYIKIEEIWKIGVAIHEKYKNPVDTILKYRYGQDIRNGINIEIIDYKIYEDGKLAYLNEQEILEMYFENRYIGEKITNSGQTEMYTKDIYQELSRYF